MDIPPPVCLSQSFVNKQNVRSFTNILRKTSNEDFCKNIIVKDKLVSDPLFSDLCSIIYELKNNLKEKSSHEFKDYFSELKENKLYSIRKENIFIKCWNALGEIIPRRLFGGHHNLNIFRIIVRTAIYGMYRQHILLVKLIEKWNFSVPPWKEIPESLAQNILYNILLWLLKNIVSAMLCLNFYISTSKLDADEYKLHYFWKPHWQSFYDKTICKMIYSKIIKKFGPYCTGKQYRRKLKPSDCLKLKLLKKDIPKLHIVLKPNNAYRPIVRYKNEVQSSAAKHKIKERLHFLKVLTKKIANDKIELQYLNIYEKWLKHNKPKLYFIKSDLSNAFGYVNREKVIKILSERHLEYQKKEKNIFMKKKIAQQYKDMLAELRRPLLVRAGSTVFEWKEGLVQGYKYSPALSELYYTYMDEIYFSKHLNKSENHIKLFIRVVDDYLYITDTLDDAHSFLNALSNYRNVNYDKTLVNFEHDTAKFCENISFLGYSYNTINLQVSRASTIYFGQMCYKIAFTEAIINLDKFLANRIGQSGIQINGHIFNLQYNRELIWHHIFTTLCLSANKFCTIMGILCNENEMHNYLAVYKKKVTVKLCNTIINVLMKHKPTDVDFIYCINHLHYLSWYALSLCAKKTPKCSVLVPYVKDEMARTNCLFGKWREHACRISTCGQSRLPAIKEVCRRTDLRIIVNSFDTLPTGFECYNHKKILNG